MLLIFALIVAVLFVYLCRGLLKKYPYHFYAVAVLITVLVSFVNLKNAPVWFERCVVSLFSRGAFGTALFIIVMYTGALKNGTKRIAELMKIRGELSILAAIFVLAHNITYGKVYFKMLFTKPANLPLNQLLAAVVSVFLITDMLVLTVLSFPQVRSKMRAVTWKKIQRTAYLFYAFTACKKRRILFKVGSHCIQHCVYLLCCYESQKVHFDEVS
jgi:DMSO/TMAO reductase YedYZ heme-binding membrane subunit